MNIQHQRGAAVATITAEEEEDRAPVVVSETAAIMQVIERAARDPSVDIDKMERLIAMRERMYEREAELEYDRAMSLAQKAMSAVRADANNPQTKSRYASYFALDNAVRPIYTEHGFSLSFDTADGAPDGFIRIVCKVAHPSGHRERPHIDMPADGKGAKGGDVMTKTHATGSAVTYGKRYLLGMIFNIAVGGDVDGNAADGETISEEQRDELQELIDANGADIAKFCTFMKVEALAEIPVRNFGKAKQALLDWARKATRK